MDTHNRSALQDGIICQVINNVYFEDVALV